VLRGGNDLKFRAPDLHNMHNKRLREQIISDGITSVDAAQASVSLVSESGICHADHRLAGRVCEALDPPQKIKHRIVKSLIAS
jgi:hypothetical protein